MSKRTIHTAGYGGTTPTDLVKMLEEAGVEYVIDIRRHDRRAFRGYYNPGLRNMGVTLSKFIYRNAIAFGNYFQAENSNGLDEYATSMSNPDDNMIMDIIEVAVTCKQYVTCFICCEKCAYVDGEVNCHRVYVAKAVAEKLREITGEEWSIIHL